MRRYCYVGPSEIAARVTAAEAGREIRSAADLLPFANGEPLTYVIDVEGVLRVADRRSEHVAALGVVTFSPRAS